MARSFDIRRDPGGPIYDPARRLRAFRGQRRYGDLGRVTPGDELENTRDHERIWLELGKLRRHTNESTPPVTVPSGPGGPVSYVGQFDLTTFLRDLGATAYYKFAEGSYPSADGTTADYIIDSSGYTTVLDMDFVNTKTGTYNTWVQSDSDTNDNVFGDDGALRFNTVPASASFGSYQGQAVTPNSGGGLSTDQNNKYCIQSDKLTFMLFVKPQDSGVSGFISQIIGWWGTYDGGSTDSGLGLLWVEDSSSFELRNKYSGVTQSVYCPVSYDEWYHVAVVIDTLNITLYVNGVEIGSMTVAGIQDTSGDRLSIGSGWFDYGVTNRYGHFYGSVDELAFFSGTALTQEDIVNVQLVASVDPEVGYVSGALNGSTSLQDHSVSLDKLQPGTEDYVIKMGATDAEWGLIADASVAADADIDLSKTRAGIRHITSGTTDTATATDNIIVISVGNQDFTLTLPSADTHDGQHLTVIWSNGFDRTLTIQRAGGDVIQGVAGSTVTSVASAENAQVWKFVSDSTSGGYWFTTHGTQETDSIKDVHVISSAAIKRWKISDVASTKGAGSASSNISVLAESLVLVDCSLWGANHTTYLPAATGSATGKRVTIKKIDAGAYTVTVNGGGTNIDGAATYVIPATQYSYVTVVSDGSVWHVVASG